MREQVSALMDGELDGAEQAEIMQALADDDALQEDWQLYHLIGDALRGEAAGSTTVAARVSERLADEPALQAPPRLPHGVLEHDASRHAGRPAANRVFYSVAASLAGVAFVAWAVWQSFAPATPAAVQAPSALAQQPASSAAQPVAYQSQVRDYWMAHRQLSGHMSDSQDQQVQFVSVETSGEDRQ